MGRAQAKPINAWAKMMGFASLYPSYMSRHHEREDTAVVRAGLDAVARHRFDDRPFLPKQRRRFMDAWCVDLDATGPPLTFIRDLKEEGIAGRLPCAIDWGLLLSHECFP